MINLNVQQSSTLKSVHPKVCPRTLLARSLSCLAVSAGLLLSGVLAHAQPVLKLRVPFDDAGPGTTTPSDTSGGGVAVTLQMLNYAGTPTDYHGPDNSGVAGGITGSRAVDFTAITRQGGNGSVVAVTNSSLGFGSVNAFTVTMWYKNLDSWHTDNNYGGRLFLLGPPGFSDTGSANSMGMKYQAANQLQFQLNTVVQANANFSDLPTNKWIFVAVTCDGTDIKIYEGTDTSASTLISTTSAAGQSVDFGSSGAICIGNRANRQRAFKGWIDDFRFYTGAADAAFVENLRSTAAGNPPVVANVYPDGVKLQQATNTLSFTTSSPGNYTITNIQVLLNGADMSSSLVITGPDSNKSVTYAGLQPDTAYSVSITAQDVNGSLGNYSGRFDTFNPTNFIFEAEDFDYTDNGVSGLFIDNPAYTSVAAANSYFGRIGTEGIDEHEQLPADGVPTYRVGDAVATVNIVGELQRQQILDAQALDPNVVDHIVGYWQSGEWVNYTRTYPAGKYNVYARVSAGGGAASISLGQVTSGQGTSSQTVTPLGTFTSTGTSWNSYMYVPLRDGAGNLVVLDLDGTPKTLRATSGSGNNVNFYMLAAANTNLPTISNVYPDGQKLFQATNKFVFTAASPAGINANSIQLILNGTNVVSQFSSNVTAQLVIGGSSTSRDLSFSGLLPNMTYTANISATDLNGNSVATTITFDTYAPSFVWEAEEFDFNNGQFIDNPAYTAAAQGNSYYGTVGTVGVDENGATGTGVGSTSYRPAPELVNTPISLDPTRQRFVDAGVPDHIVGNATAGQWMNYTKTFPAGTYNVYVRAACSGTATLRFQQVTAGWGTTVQGLAALGTCSFTGAGWSVYGYVPLRDRYGNLANVTFTGTTNTIRVTQDAIANVNFFMLLPASTALARIDHIYPDGSAHLQATNQFSFTASSSYGIDTANIQVTLNGVNIWSSLAFSGTASSWNVSYPGLAPNSSYTAVLRVTDNNGSVATTTVYFDTFSPANFTWQAEDYDFGNGTYIDNPTPSSTWTANSYWGQVGVDFVDYEYAQTVANETFLYRASDYIGTQLSGDTMLPGYVAAQQIDGTVQNYNVAWWQTNAWMNYTRTFPTGNYYIYGRLAGVTAGQHYTNALDKVTGGWGTGTQTMERLGTFEGVGGGAQIWQWVRLTTNGQPVVVSLSGTNTLRVTTLSGGDNADFYMLVSAPAASVSLTAAIIGSNIRLSFPTQTGYSYTVLYKDALTGGTWMTLGTAIPGDGSVKTASDGPIGTKRFYRLAIQ